MPAYFDCGFSVREPMWHGQGNVLEAYPENWDDARLAAGLMWEPTEVPLFVKAGGIIPVGGVDHGRDYEDPTIDEVETEDMGDGYLKLSSFKAIARDDTGEVLSVPTGGYSVISHALMGEILDAVLDADGAVKFETAGSCRGGRQVWAVAYLDEPFTIPGDDTETFPFLAMLNSHDGSAACKVTYTNTRVVCWNTFQMASAEGDKSGAQYVFRHQGNATERIVAAKEALAGLRSEAAAYREFATELAATPIDAHAVKTFTEAFIVHPAEHGEFVSDRVDSNIKAARASFSKLYNESMTTETIRGTAYGLLQASTEYLDHVRVARSRDTYMGRTLLRSEPMKMRAVSLVREVAGIGAGN
jgi:phage/plasmid-like protein (TIGR03299 family)